MRILWLSATSSIKVDSTDKRIGGGWITSLEQVLDKKSDIFIGRIFISNQENKSQYTIGNTTYFPVPGKIAKNRFVEIINRWAHKLEPESLLEIYIKIIHEFKPDIIHIFGTEFIYGLVISKTTVPCIIHLQGSLSLVKHKWFDGISAIDMFRYSKKWLLIQGYGSLHEYFFFKKAAERELKIFKECHYFMGRTDWDRRITSVLAPEAKYFHCDEIIRQEFYLHNWQPYLYRNKLVIITTMRDCTYKGLETLFESQKILQKSFDENKITWKIAGIDENDEIVYLIERKYKDSFKNNNFNFLGRLEEKELLAEMLDADLFVHPSHIDNSPNTVCEAMLLGMPIIATYAGGIPSILENNKEGFLVQDGDPFALAGAIIELFKDNNNAVSKGKNARTKAMVRHNPEVIADRVVNIYSSILSNI
ncbi:MAG: glycosyltransferase [Lentimicrobiaceae bacterium]|jgi:glycosyltransferase involved in cell wall biosynthesis